MQNRILRVVFGLIVALFLASAGPSAQGSSSGPYTDGSATVTATCPDGTHWDSATGTCR